MFVVHKKTLVFKFSPRKYYFTGLLSIFFVKLFSLCRQTLAIKAIFKGEFILGV